MLAVLISVPEVPEGAAVHGAPTVLTGIPAEARGGRRPWQASRGVLRGRMERAGLTPSWADASLRHGGWNAHHIIPVEFSNKPVFVILREHWGWDHHDEWINSIALPTTLGVVGAEHLPVHQGSGALRGHGEYNWQIRQRLRVIWEEFELQPDRVHQEVMELIDEIRGRLISGDLRGRIL